MLAHDIVALVPDGVTLFPRSKAETDVTAANDVEAALNELHPDVIINCAAYTRVDEAESQPDKARSVNGVAVGALGAAVARSGENALVIHFSTDYVFGGTSRRPYRETDAQRPLGQYGASKALGEALLLASGARCVIVRTQWLFGYAGKSFVRTMWERACMGLPTRVVNDQTGRPTYTPDLARAIWRLADVHAAKGGARETTLHVTNAGIATWYDLALEVFGAAGRPELLSACASSEFPVAAARPHYSVLDASRYEQFAGAALPDWRDALSRFLPLLGKGRAA